MVENPIPVEVVPEWERIFTEDTEPRGLSIYQAVFDSAWCFPLQRKDELRLMMEKARTVHPVVVAEIGSDKGGGFYHWIKCLRTVKKAIAVEIRGVPFAQTFERGFPDVKQCCIGSDSRSQETLATVEEFLNHDLIDCLFLDGEKAMVGSDFEAWLPFMRKGGLVFIHDINEPIETQRVFRKLGSKYRTETILSTEEGRIMKAMVERGYKPKNSWEQWNGYWGARSCGVGVVRI